MCHSVPRTLDRNPWLSRVCGSMKMNIGVLFVCFFWGGGFLGGFPSKFDKLEGSLSNTHLKHVAFSPPKYRETTIYKLQCSGVECIRINVRRVMIQVRIPASGAVGSQLTGAVLEARFKTAPARSSRNHPVGSIKGATLKLGIC